MEDEIIEITPDTQFEDHDCKSGCECGLGNDDETEKEKLMYEKCEQDMMEEKLAS